MQLNARNIMSKNVLFAHQSHSFVRVARLLFEMNIHHLPVVDDHSNLVGIISSNDILKAYSFGISRLEKPDDETLNKKFSILELMTPNPLSVSPDASISEIAQLFIENRFHALPVVEGDKILGIITSWDVVKFFAENGV
jgi:CBS domain-containing protein